MPLTTIEFNHKGQIVHAEVVYNFSQLSNTVLIIPTDHKEEFKDDILLVRENDRWKTSSPVKKRFPTTFNNIITCINKTLNIQTFSERIFSMHKFLS